MKQDPTIHDLFPNLSEQELKIAEENIRRYLALVVRIVERLESEGGHQG